VSEAHVDGSGDVDEVVDDDEDGMDEVVWME
jgi:hypothetical protein